MKLSVCVVTMNRAKQLSEAIRSCLSCELPKETEFVIIDNASSDDTENTVRESFSNSQHPYYYEKMSENLGVGGGRNYAYNRSCGELVYMLDDDAVIDTDKCRDFFIKAVQIFNDYPNVVSLTSQIYDTAWRRERVDICGSAIGNELYECFMFCGGSHFLRRAFYVDSPYLPNKYGYEELPPSLIAVDKGKTNAFCPYLHVIHKPAVNKWNYTEDNNIKLLISGIALPYAIKYMMYPKITRPFVNLFYTIRKKIYLVDKEARRNSDATVKEVFEHYKLEHKIHFRTFVRLVITFGKTAI